MSTSLIKLFPVVKAWPLRLKQLTKNLKIILSQTSITYLIRHESVIFIVGLHLYRRMPTSKHCRKKNSGARWARTSNLWIKVILLSQLSYVGRYVEWDLNIINTVQRLSLLRSYTSLRHECILILLKRYVWTRSSRCEHLILPITSTAIFLIKRLYF